MSKQLTKKLLESFCKNHELFEGVKDVQKKYVDTGKISKEEFDKAVEKDPSKNKKYLEWMVRQVIANPTQVSHVYDVVYEFSRLVAQQKITGEESNIEKYDLQGLDAAVEKASAIKSRKEKVEDALKDLKVVYDGPLATVYFPQTHEASLAFRRKFGGEDDIVWCTARENPSYWNHYFYRQKTNLYYIVEKKTNKFFAVEALADGSYHAQDQFNHTVDYKKLVSRLGFA